MNAAIKKICTLIIISVSGVFFSSFYNEGATDVTPVNFPYKQAGLTQRQAAAHLLSRFTFGAKPGDIDAVVNMGLEKWFLQQLNAGITDDSLNRMLSSYDALKMSNTQVVNTFPKGGQVLRMAVREGIIDKDSAKPDKKEYRDEVAAYMQKKGLRPQQELFRQFINQKILRATYSNNQLQELLTDFWFNHFNVSITKNDCAEFIPSYERDVIRPNVFGKFQDLLMASAKSPAMLMYLDNFSSAGTNTNLDLQLTPQQRKRVAAQMEMQMGDTSSVKGKVLNKLQQRKKAQGLNENYAREVMELHTLGVDGGYTQQDVTQAARVITGWTVYPMSEYGYGSAMKNMVDKIGEDKLTQRGFVRDGDFLFAVNRHDNQEKVVLGKKFSANGGYEEGVQLMTMLAHHPSTAKFIARKIAVRFVNDNPQQSLVDKMVKTFMEKDGDIIQVLITMAQSPEFWSKESLREKTKSPFELAISTVRSLNASVTQPIQLNNWITKMGQKMYFYQAPTGYPDRGQYWINTGALLNRMNFGLALASQRIPGIKINLLALNKGHEPESAEDALVTYSRIIMPERDLTETVKRLTPLLNDPKLEEKIDEAAGKNAPPQQAGMTTNEDAMMSDDMMDKKLQKDKAVKKGLGKNNTLASMQTVAGSNTMMSQVVGIIIGSPEFQRK